MSIRVAHANATILDLGKEKPREEEKSNCCAFYGCREEPLRKKDEYKGLGYIIRARRSQFGI